MSEQDTPFISLGKHLKFVREQLELSLADVSGAVEIDETKLARIEAGEERPAEDILLLLISHFGVKDQEAVQLWELAEYDNDVPEQFRPNLDAVTGGKPIVMLLALDARTMYSDDLQVQWNQAGMTLNFMQSSSKNQALPIARIGMSFEQTERVIAELQRALLQARYMRGPRALPPPSAQAE